MQNLAEIKLVKLGEHDITKIRGGSILFPWKIVLKGAKYLMDAAGVIDAIGEFKEGYKDCRCQS